ncbi:hypothetical protein [Streptomyces sp. NPDC058252]|uniref:hypothetical protein n=1 Tax=Streptomyces sp. NPDC058252 TaxID=3346405 RepID=UPI0036EBA3B6
MVTQANTQPAHRILQKFVISRYPHAKVNMVIWSCTTLARERIQEWLDGVARDDLELGYCLAVLAQSPDLLLAYREVRTRLADLRLRPLPIRERPYFCLPRNFEFAFREVQRGSGRDGTRGLIRPDPDTVAQPSLTVVFPFRAAHGDRGRLPNRVAAVLTVAEQDWQARGARYLDGLVDNDVAVRNPGAFNKSRAMDISFDRSGGADVLCFLDADSLVEPGFLKAVRARMAAGTNVLAPFTELVFLDHRSSIAAIRRRLKPRPAVMPGSQAETEAENEAEASAELRGFAVCVSRGWYLRCGGFDEWFRGWGHADNEFWQPPARTGVAERGRGELRHLWHRRPVVAGAQPVRPNKHLVGISRPTVTVRSTSTPTCPARTPARRASPSTCPKATTCHPVCLRKTP